MQTLRSLFGLLLVAGSLYGAWTLLPPYYNNYRLEETIEDAAREGTSNYRWTETDVRQNVLKEARELQIPLAPEALHVNKVNSEVQVWAEYTVHVDIPGYPVDLHFQPMSKSRKRAL